MGTFQSTPTMWCHSVTDAGKLLAAKPGNPKKSQGAPAASVKQSQGGDREARPRRPKEGGSVKDLESIYQKKEKRENCEKIVKNRPINKIKVMTENCEIVQSIN